jgi:hypothetical protein
MAPRLILNPNSGTVGSRAAATGFGFGSVETVEVYWDNPRTLLGAVAADVSGTFIGTKAVRFKVPAEAPVGVNKIYGQGKTTGAIGVAWFTVQ